MALSRDASQCNFYCDTGWTCGGGSCCRTMGGISQCQQGLFLDPCN